MRHSVYLNELAASRDPSGRMVMIFDLGCTKYERSCGGSVDSDVEMWRCMLVFVRAMAAVFGPNYPRVVKALLVTRAPPAFWIAWRTARTFSAFFPAWLEPRMRVFSDAALPQLLDYMPLDSVPVCLGGNNPNYPMLNTGGYLHQRPADGCVATLRLHPWARANREPAGLRLWQPDSPAAKDSPSTSVSGEAEHPLSRSAVQRVREMLHVLIHTQPLRSNRSKRACSYRLAPTRRPPNHRWSSPALALCAPAV